MRLFLKAVLKISLFVGIVVAGCGERHPTNPPGRAAATSVGTLPERAAPAGMVWVAGGEFRMGTDEEAAYAPEKPAHAVRVDGFWMDATEVTNAEFARFVKATHYVTVAERKPTWDELREQLPPDTPRVPDSQLVAGSLVFTPPTQPVSLDDYSQWWTFTAGADWRHPAGAGSSIQGLENHPVVHVAYADALAYATWAGKRLPTEAEWELAARGGLREKRFAWGDEETPGGKHLANTFQGHFPEKNTGADGFLATAPVKQFAPNGYGAYDLIGNVWEWTTDWYDANGFQKQTASVAQINPTGPAQSFDPQEPFSKKRVTKGGSFLCSDGYCANYRPSARQGTAHDSGASHIGFRCVKSGEN